MLITPAPRAIPQAFFSKRLLLRCPLPGDGAAVNAGILESLPELRPWMEWAEDPPTLSDTEANQLAARADFLRGTKLRMLMIERSTGEFVGVTSLHSIDWSVPRMEIGYWCCTSFTGRGFVTEAVRAITRFAFDQLGAERLEIRCDALNLPSLRVAERAGFELEGTLRNGDLRLDGSLEDTRVYSMIPAQFARLAIPLIHIAAGW
ncbi:MAG: GNAT family N-acetyltransferase [Actinomycetota bacterium]